LKGGWARVGALSSARRARLRRTLRALDGRTGGASYRQIASMLFGEPRGSEASWRTSSLRASVIRLCASGRKLARGGYARLLSGRPAAVDRAWPAPMGSGV
jgi:hypothetical protein